MSELRFLNPDAEIRHTENRLPHWQQKGAVYFVTFRLADEVPTRLRDQWENERGGWLRPRFVFVEAVGMRANRYPHIAAFRTGTRCYDFIRCNSESRARIVCPSSRMAA
jgi:hypothetical protein